MNVTTVKCLQANQMIVTHQVSVKIFRNVAATSPVPAGLRNHYFCIPSTTNNLMNNQDPKVSAPLMDYTNIKTIFDPQVRTQDHKQAQTPAGTSSGLFMIHDTGRASYPTEESLRDSKKRSPGMFTTTYLKGFYNIKFQFNSIHPDFTRLLLLVDR